jgi:ABC-type Fe3+ transport system substrate-binding protein
MNRAKLLAALLVLAFFLPVSSPAAEQGREKIIEGAKKEGKLRLGITTRWEEAGKPAAKKMVEAFQSVYPFIKIDYQRVGGSRERERILAELAAGKITYDVSILSETQVPIAQRGNLVELVDWRGLGVPPGLVHPAGFTVTPHTQVYGITYNRKLIPEAVGSKLAWEDCANPKWRKKVAMDTRPRHLEVFWQPHVWGREKTLKHARDLAANQTIFERDRNQTIAKLILGEYPIVCGNFFSHYFEEVRGGNADHLGFTPGEIVAIAPGSLAYIPRGAANPNAAKLWTLWWVSEAGQKIQDEIEGNAHPSFAWSRSAKMTKGKKVYWYEPEWMGKADEILKEILAAVGLPVVQ